MKAIFAVPATLALVYRAHSHNSLTPLGIVAAALTAAAHALHPWNLPFVLLVVFFLAGTRVTKVKKEVKARLTLSASSSGGGGGGGGGGEGPRTHVQVLANSGVASVLALVHAYQLSLRRRAIVEGGGVGGAGAVEGTMCFSWGKASDVLVIGIIANYAAVCADTFSSELGILSTAAPRLITSWDLRRVPPGTNGGVTAWGLLAGLLGSVVIVTASFFFLPLCEGWGVGDRFALGWGLAVWGALGSVLDSLLGGWLQRSVRDVRTGKIVEGDGGVRVLVHSDRAAPSQEKGRVDMRTRRGGDDDGKKMDGTAQAPKAANPARVVESGVDLLDNNQVNFLMASTMSVGAMAVAGWYWDVPLGIWPRA